MLLAPETETIAIVGIRMSSEWLSDIMKGIAMINYGFKPKEWISTKRGAKNILAARAKVRGTTKILNLLSRLSPFGLKITTDDFSIT
jgi:hypothetical protein